MDTFKKVVSRIAIFIIIVSMIITLKMPVEKTEVVESTIVVSVSE